MDASPWVWEPSLAGPAPLHGCVSEVPEAESPAYSRLAVVGREGQEFGGVLPPGTSVAKGEFFAILQAYRVAEASATICSDCLGAVRLWRRCLKPSASRYAGALQDLLPAVAQARRQKEGVQVIWMPSHRTREEAEHRGIPQHAWEGNNRADALANKMGLVAAAPVGLVQEFVGHRTRAESAAWLVATVQLQRLQQRMRVEGGHAVKARRRNAPAMPRRLRQKGPKRVCLASAALPAGDIRGLLLPSIRANTAAEEAARLLGAAVGSEGFHDLWPLGPWPEPGSRPPLDGRLQWPWVCRVCQARAADSSRAVAGSHVRVPPGWR